MEREYADAIDEDPGPLPTGVLGRTELAGYPVIAGLKHAAELAHKTKGWDRQLWIDFWTGVVGEVWDERQRRD